jgi:hypothetical protein
MNQNSYKHFNFLKVNILMNLKRATKYVLVLDLKKREGKGDTK